MGVGDRVRVHWKSMQESYDGYVKGFKGSIIVVDYDDGTKEEHDEDAESFDECDWKVLERALDDEVGMEDDEYDENKENKPSLIRGRGKKREEPKKEKNEDPKKEKNKNKKAKTASENKDGKKKTSKSKKDIEELVRLTLPRLDEAKSGGICCCNVLLSTGVECMRKIAKVKNVDSKGVEKKELGKLLCGNCGTGKEEKIPEKYRFPKIDLQGLSIIDAVHLHIMYQLEDELDGVRQWTNQFRAHLLKHLVTNGQRYFIERKINRVAQNGADVLVLDGFNIIVLKTAFNTGVQAFIKHYRDVHNAQTCGLLRRGRRCIPFQVFANCDARVEQIVTNSLGVLQNFIIIPDVDMFPQNLPLHVTPVDRVYPNQPQLRNHFFTQQQIQQHFGVQ